jgi:hypothetical protein
MHVADLISSLQLFAFVIFWASLCCSKGNLTNKMNIIHNTNVIINCKTQILFLSGIQASAL